MEVVLFALGWAGLGIVAGQLLSYPGDGLNFRHFFGAVIGPIALIVVLVEHMER